MGTSPDTENIRGLTLPWANASCCVCNDKIGTIKPFTTLSKRALLLRISHYMFRLLIKPSSGVSKHRILKVVVTDPLLKLIAVTDPLLKFIAVTDPLLKLQLLLVFYVLIHLMMA
jgi:hypothetical protein